MTQSAVQRAIDAAVAKLVGIGFEPGFARECVLAQRARKTFNGARFTIAQKRELKAWREEEAR